MFITGNLGKDMPPIQKILRAKNSSLYKSAPPLELWLDDISDGQIGRRVAGAKG
jgi:hypothetical protein